MDLSAYKTISLNGTPMKAIYIDGTRVWKRPAVNRVPLSINADGSIYNGTGYKNGYRIRSGGAEAAQANTTCTGFIKVNPGDVVRLSGWNVEDTVAAQAINAADSSFTNIGQITSQPAHYGIFAESAYSAYRWASVTKESDGVWKWIVPPAASGVAYIRVTAYDHTMIVLGASMIVTVNEEIA